MIGKWGKIGFPVCTECGKPATHYLKKYGLWVTKKRDYCEKHWLQEIKRLGLNHIR